MKVCNLLLAFAAVSPVFAHAATNDSFYVDGSFGRDAQAGYDPTTNVIDFGAGYRWSWFAVEAGYVDFKRTSADVFLNHTPLSVGTEENGFTTGVAGHWDIVSNWYLSARTGAFFWRDSFYESQIGKKGLVSHDSGTSWYAGVGAGYDFNKNFSLGVSYDWYDANDSTAHVPSLKAEVRF